MRAGSDVLRRIIDAHGGIAFWDGLEAIEAEISAWGLLFVMKRRPALRRVRVTAAAHEPRFTFHDYPDPGTSAELLGNEEVRLVETDGRIVARRVHPRAAMGSFRRRIYWDVLDFVYFGGYAMWNYLTAPFLLVKEGVRCEVISSARRGPPAWTLLQAHFPSSLPTHCPTQTFRFDERWQLRRLDYTAEVVGRWAHAAHQCEDYGDFDGYLTPTRRRVLPLLGRGKPLPGPLLVGIDLHSLRVVRRS